MLEAETQFHADRLDAAGLVPFGCQIGEAEVQVGTDEYFALGELSVRETLSAPLVTFAVLLTQT